MFYNNKDQMGRAVQLKEAPKRIISLVPSQTELLYDLGADETIVGITKFCIHPNEWFKRKKRIGGTKEFNFEKIAALKPDLIIGNKEENEQKQIEELMKLYPVWMSDIKNLDDSLQMISSIGQLTERPGEAEQLVNEIQNEFRKIKDLPTLNIPTAYLIWNEPIMVAGTGTFIDEMLQKCGLQNIFSKTSSRYPEITAEELQKKTLSLILLSSEPYPFKEKHIEAFRVLCPDAIIKLVDGEMFSWYGSRLKYAPAYFRELTISLAQKRGLQA